MHDFQIADLLARAVSLHNEGRLAEAEALYGRILQAAPDHFDALHMLGVIRHQQGRDGEAFELIGRALAARPQSAWALSNLGVALLGLRQPQDAIAAFEGALRVSPNDVETISNLAGALFQAARHDEALAACERALRIKPNDPEALNTRGNVLQETGCPEEALASYDRALSARSDFVQAHRNRGAALHALNRHQEAIESYGRALVIDPEDADAHWNESLARLCLGDLRLGFAKFEWRWRTSDRASGAARFLQPLWLGDDSLLGKTILLYGEQGVGDSVQFARYVPLVRARGGEVVLAVHRELKSLLAGMADLVLSEDEALPKFDVRCPLLSLPLAFRTELASIPAQVPYLHTDPARVAYWKARLPVTASLRVGLAWSGNPTHKNDRQRSIRFEQLAPLLEVPGIEFVSLQKEPRAIDAEGLRGSPRVIDPASELEDFSDTAAVVEGLDLIISVDTAAAHLAGALARPVWVLLPFSPDWRWLLDRDDSPWYPTARLFRQPAAGDWTSVIQRVAEALGCWARAKVEPGDGPGP
jgi:tetratricopeptide (TPR) repeat protein